MEITIPSPAPEEIPVIQGSASGFFDTACINMPDVARQAPAITAFKTRGKRRTSSKILSVSPLRQNAFLNKCKPKSLQPANVERQSEHTKIRTNMHTINIFSDFFTNIPLIKEKPVPNEGQTDYSMNQTLSFVFSGKLYLTNKPNLKFNPGR